MKELERECCPYFLFLCGTHRTRTEVEENSTCQIDMRLCQIDMRL